MSKVLLRDTIFYPEVGGTCFDQIDVNGSQHFRENKNNNGPQQAHKSYSENVLQANLELVAGATYSIRARGTCLIISIKRRISSQITLYINTSVPEFITP